MSAGKMEGCFPEESFQSLGNYGRALLQTGCRLMDRAAARSLDDAEINEVRSRSGCEMRRSLSWWDLIWLGIGAIIGAGVFVLTGQEARESAGPAVIVSYAVSGLSAMLSVLCYTEFAVEIPVAGGAFAYVRVELGDFMSFITGGNILLQYTAGCAAVARSFTSYLAALLNKNPNDLRLHISSLPSGFNDLDPIAAAVVLAICTATVINSKAISRFNSVTSITHIAALLFIVVAGFPHADFSNLRSFAPFGARGIVSSAAVLFFSYIGFDAVSTMAEEAKNPARDIPVGLVGAVGITMLVYCLLAAVLCSMVPFHEIDPDAPFAAAFQTAGMGWAKYVVAACALKGMATVLLVSGMGLSRYVAHMARARLVPACLAAVRPGSGAPFSAAAAALGLTSVVALFADLPILAGLLSICSLFIFTLVAVALIVRRYYVRGGKWRRLAACLALVVGASVGVAGPWSAGWVTWSGYAAVGAVWVGANGCLWIGVVPARRPRVWVAPFVPWLPATSVLINVFLLGSIEWESYIRYGTLMCVLILYYFFIGLHASYDAAHAANMHTDNHCII